MPIEASGEFTFRDIYRGTLLVARSTVRTYTIVGVPLFAIGLLAAIFVGRHPTLNVYLIGFGLIFIAMPRLQILLKSRRTFKSSPVVRGLTRFRFDEDGTTSQGPSSQTSLKWDGYLKWKEDKDSIVLYSYPTIGSIIPKRFFSSPADLAAARDLISSKIPRKA